MDEFYRRMNQRNAGKSTLVDFILNDNINQEDTLVLDLGAGSFVIEQMLSEKGFKGSMLAIEKNKVEVQEIKRCQMIFGDLIEETTVRITDIVFGNYKKVVVVLSAILHELSGKQIKELECLIQTIATQVEIYLVIREPLITKRLVIEKIKLSFFDKLKIALNKKFREYKKLHKRSGWNKEVMFINYCFLSSYGEQSWDREKHEGRFTFTEEEMLHFINECGCIYPTIYYEFDLFYKYTLPYNVFEKIYNTGNLIITKGRR